MADVAEISFFDNSDCKKKRNGNANFNFFFNPKQNFSGIEKYQPHFIVVSLCDSRSRLT